MLKSQPYTTAARRVVRLYIALVCVLLLPPAVANAQVGYRLIDYPASASTTPRGVNAHGDVVGEMIDGVNFGQHGFLFKESNTTYYQIDIDGADATAAFDINDNGDIVGIYSTGWIVHGFLIKDYDDAPITIDVGEAATWTVGLNNAGVVVGWAQDNAEAADRTGFMRSVGGSISGLQYPESQETVYLDINDSGTIVGNADAVPFLLNGSTFSSAYGTCPGWASDLKINNDGKIAGSSEEGFTCTSEFYTTITIPTSTGLTLAYGLNDDDIVVGIYCTGEWICYGFRAPTAPIGMRLALNAFIPYEYINDPHPNGSGYILEGDTRTLPDQDGSSRVAVNMALYNQARVPGYVFIAGPYVGIAETRRYEAATSLDDGHITTAARDDDTLGDPLMNDKGTAAQPGSPACSGSVMMSPPTGTEGGLDLHCEMDIGNGLDWTGFDPNIVWDLDLTFPFNDQDEFDFTIDGCVKEFPTYEVWGGGHVLFNTDASSTSPIAIVIPCALAIEVGVSGTQSLVDN
jgi:hypothetical protein